MSARPQQTEARKLCGEGPIPLFVGHLPLEFRQPGRLSAWLGGTATATVSFGSSGDAFAHVIFKDVAKAVLYGRSLLRGGLRVELGQNQHPTFDRQLYASFSLLLAIEQPSAGGPIPGRPVRPAPTPHSRGVMSLARQLAPADWRDQLDQVILHTSLLLACIFGPLSSFSVFHHASVDTPLLLDLHVDPRLLSQVCSERDRAVAERRACEELAASTTARLQSSLDVLVADRRDAETAQAQAEQDAAADRVRHRRVLAQRDEAWNAVSTLERDLRAARLEREAALASAAALQQELAGVRGELAAARQALAGAPSAPPTDAGDDAALACAIEERDRAREEAACYLRALKYAAPE